MDTQKVIDLSGEIIEIFRRESMNRLESMFVLETTISQINEQQLREIIKAEMETKPVQPHYIS